VDGEQQPAEGADREPRRGEAGAEEGATAC